MTSVACIPLDVFRSRDAVRHEFETPFALMQLETREVPVDRHPPTMVQTEQKLTPTLHNEHSGDLLDS